MFIALSTLVSAQFVEAVVNTIQHSVDASHGAMAKAVAHDHDQDHDAVAVTHADVQIDVSQADHTPTPHHHHADGPQLAPLMKVDLEIAPTAVAALLRPAGSVGLPLSLIYRPERPPRRLNERKA